MSIDATAGANPVTGSLPNLLDGVRRLTIEQTLLDSIIHPLIVVTRAAQVIYANVSGHEFMAGSHGLALRDGRLSAAKREVSDALMTLLGVASDHNGDGCAPGVLRLESRHAGDGKIVLLMPIRTVSVLAGDGAVLLDGLVVATVIDPPNRTLPNEQLVRNIYGLSAAEARIALQIAAGKSLAQIALDGRTSLHTVRTQLKSVFAKTGTSRQAQLALMLSSLAPAMMIAMR